jgi:hypothetical protein
MEAATEKMHVAGEGGEREELQVLGWREPIRESRDQVLGPMQRSGVRMTDPKRDCIRLPWWDA